MTSSIGKLCIWGNKLYAFVWPSQSKRTRTYKWLGSECVKMTNCGRLEVRNDVISTYAGEMTSNHLATTFAVSCRPIRSASTSSALLNGNLNNTSEKNPDSQWAIKAASCGNTAHMKTSGTTIRISKRCKLLNCSACKMTSSQ